jgi:hypothetical protein
VGIERLDGAAMTFDILTRQDRKYRARCRFSRDR